MELIQCSETSAYNIQTPGNYPEDNILHPQHGESLKTTKSPLLFDALCPLPHNLLYALTIKSYGLRDKPQMHRFLQLLVCGKPTASSFHFISFHFILRARQQSLWMHLSLGLIVLP
jgi:hypothetical protein